MPWRVWAAASATITMWTQPVSAENAGGEQVQHDRAFVEWQFKNLRDPDSANWRRMRDPVHTTVSLKRGLLGKKEWSGEIACYMLNGKNAYGAYVGYTPYAVLITDTDEVYVWEGMSASENQAAYRTYGQQIIDNHCS